MFVDTARYRVSKQCRARNEPDTRLVARCLDAEYEWLLDSHVPIHRRVEPLDHHYCVDAARVVVTAPPGWSVTPAEVHRVRSIVLSRDLQKHSSSSALRCVRLKVVDEDGPDALALSRWADPDCLNVCIRSDNHHAGIADELAAFLSATRYRRVCGTPASSDQYISAVHADSGKRVCSIGSNAARSHHRIRRTVTGVTSAPTWPRPPV